MSKNRIWTAIALLTGWFLFPPWSTPNRMSISIGDLIGRRPGGTRTVIAPLWHAPHSSAHINVTMWISLLVVGIITCFFLFRRKKKQVARQGRGSSI